VNKINADVYAHEWGFIIPCESGVVWEQQTDGVACNHVHIEGIFLPLLMPFDLLQKMKKANYENKNTKNIWKKIKEEMHFDFDIIDARYPPNQEGMLWIRLKRFESGWGHGKWVEGLVGREMVLIYPNCD
jgi:hypothetical protein